MDKLEQENEVLVAFNRGGIKRLFDKAKNNDERTDIAMKIVGIVTMDAINETRKIYRKRMFWYTIVIFIGSILANIGANIIFG
ncbi:MAG: hypothetical protein ACXAC2_00525 [Candidatus Kariarchaeaceae archaeon]|jgi:hypothetical protein